MKNAIIVHTERLTIRRISKDDAAFILELLNEASYKKMIRDSGVYTLEEARAFIQEKYMKSYQEHGHGLYLVMDKLGQIPFGICGLISRENFKYPDLGFAMLERFSGRGFTKEASHAVIKHAQDVLKLSTLCAITTENNNASQKILANCGFMPKGEIEIAEKKFQYFELRYVILSKKARLTRELQKYHVPLRRKPG